jgi:uroporphyrinogen III methyltransferase/synthase
VVERGTLPGQRTVRATLATVAERVASEEVRPPAVTVVGDVASLADRLAWLERRPLHGRTIAVTRARAQASELAARLRALGAEVVEAPAIRIRPLAGQAPDLSGYDLVCVTSPNGATLLFERLRAAGADARALAGSTVAAIGPGTGAVLHAHGVDADVVPERSTAEGLVEALREVPARRALIARAREARDVLPGALRERGIEVDVLELYETEAEPMDGDALAAARAADYVTFTSSSTVRFFLQAAGQPPGLSPATRIVSIGPVTSAALREHGLEPHVEAQRHDIDGVVDALVADAAG